MRTHIGGLFWFYQVQMRMFRSIPEESLWKPSNPVATFICGGFASTFFWLQALPFDAIKNRLQADSPTKPKYSSWFAAARQIWSEGGPKVSRHVRAFSSSENSKKNLFSVPLFI